MSQVSRRVLSKDVENYIFEIFKKTLLSLKKPQDIEDFLDDLLTPTERLMLAKRLAIALCLGKGYDYQSICDALKVTPGTVASVNLWFSYKGRGYKKAIEKIIKNQKTQEFWDDIEEFVENIIPPKRGSDWSYERRKKWKKRMERKPPV